MPIVTSISPSNIVQYSNKAAPAPEAIPAVTPSAVPEQVSTPVVAAEESKLEIPQVDPNDIKLAQLAKREKQMTSRIMELKAKEDEIKKLEADYAKNYIPRSRLAEDPISVLQEMNLDYNKLSEQFSKQPNALDPQFLQMQQRIKELEEAQNQTKNEFKENQSQQYKQAINQLKNEVTSLVETDESFETIKETNHQDAVVELIAQTFQSTGKLLTVKDAAREVEDYLLDEALKMMNLKKIKAKLSPPPAAVQTPAAVEEKVAASTLSNSVTPRAKPLTAKERRDRAIAIITGQTI